MSPPIRTPDGNEVSEIVLPDGSTASEVIDPEGNVVFEAGPDIPDSVVSRDDDNQTNSNSDRRGIKITTNSEWPSIGATLSQNVSGVSEAQLIDLSDDTTIDTVDISGLSAGDSFTFDDVNLSKDSDFSIIAWDGGNGHTSGQDGSQQNFPYTSDDVDIVNGIKNGTLTTNFASNIITVGDVGF